MRNDKAACAAIIVAAALLVACIVVVMARPAEAREIEPEWTWKAAPTDTTNRAVYDQWQRERMKGVLDGRLAQMRAALDEAAQAAYAEQVYYETYYEPTYYAPSRSSGDGFMQQGVRGGVDSDTETWYSSNAAYHYRTGEWTPDSEGYYRDADGYYVVASSDYAQGEVVNTSKGEARVYDSGPASGNIDMYVNW